MGDNNKELRKRIKRYKQVLTSFNDLKDIGVFSGRWNADSPKANQRVRYFSNDELETMRSRKACQIVKEGDFGKVITKYRSQPTYEMLWDHLRPDRIKLDTLFMSNRAGFDIIVCLVDIDDQGGGEQATQQLAEYVGHKYLNGKCYIEQSPGSIGRHVYFLLEIKYKSSESVREAIQLFKNRIQNDPHVLSFQGGANVCTVCGEPTQWSSSNDDERFIKHRGSLVKLPYFNSFESDLGLFENLVPLKLHHLDNKNELLNQIHLDGSQIPQDASCGVSEDDQATVASSRLNASRRTPAKKTATSSLSDARSVPAVSTHRVCDHSLMKSQFAFESSHVDSFPFLPSSLSTKTPLGRTSSNDVRPADGRAAKMRVMTEYRREKFKPLNADDVDAIWQRYVERGWAGESGEAQQKVEIEKRLHLINDRYLPPLSLSTKNTMGRTNLPEQYLFDLKRYHDRINELVPEFVFRAKMMEKKRREKPTSEKLACFVSIKIQDAFRQKPNAPSYEGRQSRDATVKYSRQLKESGVIPFSICPNLYTMFKELAVDFDLLCIYQQPEPPLKDSTGQRLRMHDGKFSKGRAALIGPGIALESEYADFQVIWQQIQVVERRRYLGVI